MNSGNASLRGAGSACGQVSRAFLNWPVLRQLRGADRYGRGAAVKSAGSGRLRPRTKDADQVIKSICPYCAVGCGQNVYVKGVEGGPW